MSLLPSLLRDSSGRGAVRLWSLAVMVLILLPLAPSAAAQERQVDLTLRLISDSQRIEASAGKDNPFFLELSNIGNKPITNLSLSAEAPEGWMIEFVPDEIAYLGPGSIQTVDVSIHPPDRVGGREYEVSLQAVATEMRKVHTIQVTVRSPRWLWIGAGVVAAVAVSFVALFVSQNRQEPAV